MRQLWPVLVVAVAALPARSDRITVTTSTTEPGRAQALTQRAIDALTTVDTMPDPTALQQLFGDTVAQSLMSTSLDPDADPGVAIRAIRALPSYCANQLHPLASQACTTHTEPHDTITAVIGMYQGDRTPPGLVKLRAAIEALGMTHSADRRDGMLLEPLTQHDSRDIRAAAATALGNICDQTQQDWLHLRESQEQSLQVQAALDVAIRKLKDCGPAESP